MKIIALSWRMLKRDWRASEIQILALALIIAVGCVSSVGFFTDRIRGALNQQASELMGGDLLLHSNKAIDLAYIEIADRFKLKQTQTLEFPSMASFKDRSQLTTIKAVSEGYPLRGQLEIRWADTTPETKTDTDTKVETNTKSVNKKDVGAPAPGTVWVSQQLLIRLGMQLNDSLELGEADFKVTALILRDPSQVTSPMLTIAPQLILNQIDLPQTQLIQPTSRIRYHLLMAGEPNVVKQAATAITPLLRLGESLQDVNNARPEVRTAIERGQTFLGLAALVSVLLAGTAIATTTQRFISRHLDSCAIMRCFGASQAEILQTFLYQLLWLGIITGLIGSFVGFIGQQALVKIFSSVATLTLPPPSWLPVLFGVATSLITLIGFALPRLLQLRHVSALRVLQRDLAPLPGSALPLYLSVLIALSGLIYWQTQDGQLSLYVLIGTLITLAALYLIATGLLWTLKRLYHNHHQHRFTAFAGITNIIRHPHSSTLQIMALGFGIMLLLLLTVVRDDLLSGWQDSLPENTPNQFLINIQKDQRDDLQAFFTQQGLPALEMYPMVRARIKAINSQDIHPDQYDSPRARFLSTREFNMTWTSTLSTDNQISAGQWWDVDDKNATQISVEDSIAKTLDIKLGDTVHFAAADRQFSGTVTSLRHVDWDSFKANFYIIAQPGLIDDIPASYISSLYLPDQDNTQQTAGPSILNQLVRAFPNITSININAIMNEVRTLIMRVTQAIETVFIFTLIAGFLVIYAAINATLDERQKESAMMRVFGASRRQILGRLLGEFVCLGMIAGLISAIGANLIGFVIAQRLLQLPYHFDGQLWWIGIVSGMGSAAFIALLGVRPILKTPPLQTLMYQR